MFSLVEISARESEWVFPSLPTGWIFPRDDALNHYLFYEEESWFRLVVLRVRQSGNWNSLLEIVGLLSAGLEWKIERECCSRFPDVYSLDTSRCYGRKVCTFHNTNNSENHFLVFLINYSHVAVWAVLDCNVDTEGVVLNGQVSHETLWPLVGDLEKIV